jgi:hydroxymethylglutaryl-CoA synthase
MELRRSGSASDYRGPDFRKPHRRHTLDEYGDSVAALRDFPVFSGRYSTMCYVDETLRSVEDLMSKADVAPRDFYHSVEGVFFHRPYRQMPLNAMAAMYYKYCSGGSARQPQAACSQRLKRSKRWSKKE